MSIENDLKRIADALSVIANHVTGARTLETETAMVDAAPVLGPAPDVAPAKKAKETKKAALPAAPLAPGVTAPTIDDLTDALRELVGAKGVPAARAVLQKFGCDKISAAKPEQFQGLYDEMKKAKG